MSNSPPKVIVIPAKPEMAQSTIKRQLRVAAYCRVSTDDEEQLTSYETQKNYYTDKIMTNKDWTMAGIFADEGITGTSARKRPEFLRMIRQCRQEKIDIILTKSVSRFARNTVDCLNYVRALKELGIAVIFEKENINTLESENEMVLTFMGAFSQAESESISANVKFGIRQAMREGRAFIHYKSLYAYEKGEDGRPRIIPEEAEVVRTIFEVYRCGNTLRTIKQMLEQSGVPNVSGGKEWSIQSIRNLLSNEKYCGDVLMQKTFTEDCISKKKVKNTGQLPMYLIQNHHDEIVSRAMFDAVQAELARRNAIKQTSIASAPTGLSRYSSKFALTERLVCGECGTQYRRCTWAKRGKKRVVWRCVSRLDYGTKYCHESPTLDEAPLQRAILAAVSTAIGHKDPIIRDITGAMELELAPIPGESISLADIERRLDEITHETRKLIVSISTSGRTDEIDQQLKNLLDETITLKEKRSAIQKLREENDGIMRQMENAVTVMQDAPAAITEWDESLIRQLVDTVKVVSAEKIIVYIKGGVEIEQVIQL